MLRPEATADSQANKPQAELFSRLSQVCTEMNQAPPSVVRLKVVTTSQLDSETIRGCAKAAAACWILPYRACSLDLAPESVCFG